ncbi:MAG: glycosyltransferase family 2 protein [Magnetococcus sp. WYHC-3]
MDDRLEADTMSAAAPEISVVIPFYNEEENLAPLLQNVLDVMRRMGRSFEVVCVDDGSRDATFAEMARVKAGAPEMVALQLRRNFGQTAAMKAGFDAARGTLVVSLDGDRQNDPVDIPRLIRCLEEQDVDLVAGWRRRRQDTLFSRRIPSQIANRLIGAVTGVHVHDYGCSLKAYRADLIKNLPLYGEMHRFIPALANLYGARITELEVTHHPRVAGTSKYNLTRTFRVVVDLLNIYFFQKFTTRPLHLLGWWGLLLFLTGLSIDLWLTVDKLVFGAQLANRPLLLMGTLFILVGVVLFSQGLILELLSRTYYESQHKSTYTLRRRL